MTISPEERELRRKQTEAVRVQHENRKRVLAEIFKRVPAELTRHEVEFVALRYFQQLGHDHQHRIFNSSRGKEPKIRRRAVVMWSTPHWRAENSKR